MAEFLCDQFHTLGNAAAEATNAASVYGDYCRTAGYTAVPQTPTAMAGSAVTESTTSGWNAVLTGKPGQPRLSPLILALAMEMFLATWQVGHAVAV